MTKHAYVSYVNGPCDLHLYTHQPQRGYNIFAQDLDLLRHYKHLTVIFLTRSIALTHLYNLAGWLKMQVLLFLSQ